MCQLLYELCFCLWSVSLCDEAKQDFMNCGAVPILAQQVRDSGHTHALVVVAPWIRAGACL